MRIFRKVSQMFDFKDDVADGEFLKREGGLLVGAAAGGGSPTGAAGGVLGGTYPNPSFAADMATQAELDAEAGLRVAGDAADAAALAAHLADSSDAHDASAVSFVPTGTIAATDVQAAIAEVASEAVADLAPAVIIAPASSARNVIQPTAGAVIAAIIRAHAAQSVDLTQWQTSDGTSVLSVGKHGQVFQDFSWNDTPDPWFASLSRTHGFRSRLLRTPTADDHQTYNYGVEGRVDVGGNQQLGTTYGLKGLAVYQGTDTTVQSGVPWVSGAGFRAQDYSPEGVSIATGYIRHTRGIEAAAIRSGVGGGLDNIGVDATAALYQEDTAGTGSLVDLIAVKCVASVYQDASAAVLPSAVGVLVESDYSGSLSVTNAYGLLVYNSFGAAGVTNAYGIYVAAQSGATNVCGIYVAGGKSVFVDSLITGKIALPADADFANGQGAWWWDQANSLPKWKGKTSGGVVVNFTPLQASDLTPYVPKSLYDANTILAATSDDTPAALTVAASTFVGRKASGNIAAMSATEAKAVLAIAESDVTNLTTDLAAKQPLDADLTAIAGLTSAADKGIQFTGAGTAATYDLTTAGKALLDDANAAAQRATLGTDIYAIAMAVAL